MPADTVLCWNPKVTVADYETWRDQNDAGRAQVAEFFYNRMVERYINPVKALDCDEKNGFSIMAVSCLLIETYETFRQGWSSSEKQSKAAFCYFFDREDLFAAFRGHAQDFYKNVRCGILHQGETGGGWRITRKSELPLFDGARTVNATKFHSQLQQVISNYRDALKVEPVTAGVWKNFREKMKATIKNCEP